MGSLLFMRVVERGDQEEVCESTALAVITSFQSTDLHHTYTLQPLLTECVNKDDDFGDIQDYGDQRSDEQSRGE